VTRDVRGTLHGVGAVEEGEEVMGRGNPPRGVAPADGHWRLEGLGMALTKRELAEAIAGKLECKRDQAANGVDQVFESMKAALERGESLKISGFGSFPLNFRGRWTSRKLRDKRARTGRNPKTGEQIEISARRVVLFHPNTS